MHNLRFSIPWHHRSRVVAHLFFGWAAALVLTLLWDVSGLDLPVLQAIGTPDGFPWRHHWLLEPVLHDGLRRLAQAFYLLLGLWVLWPEAWPGPAIKRRERLTLVVLVALSLLAINLVKYHSLTSCPWDLQTFGGRATPVSHWNLWVADGGPGRCFPGGHASSALAFLPLCLPWLLPPQGTEARPPATGWRWLVFLLCAGTIAGATQTLRGAHPPSHTLWTFLICAAVSLAGWLAGGQTLAGRNAVSGGRPVVVAAEIRVDKALHANLKGGVGHLTP
jgi:membrane-associated PAP2 superfamily phosphatase